MADSQFFASSAAAASGASNAALSATGVPKREAISLRSLDSMSPTLRRSVPSVLANHPHHQNIISSPSGSISPSIDQFIFPIPTNTTTNSANSYRRPSRSFKESRVCSATGHELDAGHIQLYLKKRDSRASINGSLHSLSRPITADSTKANDEQLSTSTVSSHIVNINPRPRGSRLINVQPRTASIEPCATSTSASGDDDGKETTKRADSVPLSPHEALNESELIGAVPPRYPPLPTTPITIASAAWQLARPRSHYVGTVVWQVDDTVFCGGEEAPLNLNMLCRLKIEYIVDLSGRDEDTFRSVNRVECPCLCPRKTAHARFTMTVRVKDEGQKQNLISYFEDVVGMVRRAKACGKCVLVHSADGRNRAPAFIAAYLMHEHQWTRLQAINQLQRIRPSVHICDHLQRALMRWQSILGIRSSDASGSENGPLDPSLFNVKRTAWT